MREEILSVFMLLAQACEKLPMVDLKELARVSPPATGYFYLVSRNNKAMTSDLDIGPHGVTRKYVDRDPWLYVSTGTTKGEIAPYLPCPGNVKGAK